MLHLQPDDILQKLSDTADMYHKLVLVVAPSGAGKTEALHAVCQSRSIECMNVNLELSKHMLELTTKQRAIHAAELLREIVDGSDSVVTVLDNLEILFDQSLHLDPLRILKELARQHTVIASWNGCIGNHGLTYGEPEHPEYRSYPATELDFLHVTTEGKVE